MSPGTPTEMTPRTHKPIVRFVRIVVLWTVFGLIGGTAVAFGASQLTGNRTFNMLTGSMAPMIRPGDVVIDEVISPREARVGDVITFTDPRNQKRLTTHRVKSVSVAGSRAYFVTRGDANDTSERWNVAADGQVGRVAYLLPSVGHARQWLGGESARLAALALLILAGLAVVVEVWRKPTVPSAPAAQAGTAGGET
jgi:signal peptidase I